MVKQIEKIFSLGTSYKTKLVNSIIIFLYLYVSLLNPWNLFKQFTMVFTINILHYFPFSHPSSVKIICLGFLAKLVKEVEDKSCSIVNFLLHWRTEHFAITNNSITHYVTIAIVPILTPRGIKILYLKLLIIQTLPQNVYLYYQT